MTDRITHSEFEIDMALEQVLKAAGSSLRHYTPQSRAALRRTMGDLLDEASEKGKEVRS